MYIISRSPYYHEPTLGLSNFPGHELESHTGHMDVPKIFREAWAQQLHGTDESHRRSGGKRFQALAEAAGKDVLEGGQNSVGRF